MVEDPRTLMSEEELEHGVVMLDSKPRFRRSWAATAAGVLLAGAGLAVAGCGLRVSSLQGTSELFENGGLLKKDLLAKTVTVSISGFHGEQLGELNGVAGLSTSVGPAEIWTLTDAGTGKVYMTSLCKQHLSDTGGGKIGLSGTAGSAEKWLLTDDTYNRIMFTGAGGQHLSRGAGHPETSANKQGFEKWTVKKIKASTVTCAQHKKNNAAAAAKSNAKALLADLPLQVFIESMSETRWGPVLGHNYETTRFSFEKGVAQTWTLSAAGDGRVFITSSGGEYLSDNNGEVSLSSRKDGWEKWTLSDAGVGAFTLKSYWGRLLSDHSDHLDTDDNHDGATEQWAIIKA